MKKLYYFILLFSLTMFAQYEKKEITINETITGDLYTPETNKKPNLVILLAGSGPTDRNGNQVGMANNSLKFLAEELAKNNTAVYTYDKRTVALLKQGKIKEATSISFNDFITDAETVLNHFQKEKKYRKIIIAGHSQGSLIGMIAIQKKGDAFISIAGPAHSIDKTITDQIEKQAPFLKKEVEDNFKILSEGKTFENKNPMLESIFNKEVQPFLTSWIHYNPQEEIAKLTIPTLILNGTRDIQVGTKDAELLKQAQPKAELQIITDMNHILKKVNDDTTENYATYSNPELPIMQELVNSITVFLKTL